MPKKEKQNNAKCKSNT